MRDDQPPVITSCPQSMLFTVQLGTPCQIVSWPEPTATDDSGVTPSVVATHTSGFCFNIGVTDVSYVFTDSSGNEAICSFTVTGKYPCNFAYAYL